MPRANIDESLMVQLYHQGLTQVAIAKQLNISEATVYRRLVALGLKKPPTHSVARIEANKKLLTPLVQEGLTTREIANRLCVSVSTAFDWLKEAGLKARLPQRFEIPPRKLKPEQIEQTLALADGTRSREEMAEQLGIKPQTVVKRVRQLIGFTEKLPAVDGAGVQPLVIPGTEGLRSIADRTRDLVNAGCTLAQIAAAENISEAYASNRLKMLGLRLKKPPKPSKPIKESTTKKSSPPKEKVPKISKSRPRRPPEFAAPVQGEKKEIALSKWDINTSTFPVKKLPPKDPDFPSDRVARFEAILGLDLGEELVIRQKKS